MKKLLGILVLGLWFSSTAHALTLSCNETKKMDSFNPHDCDGFHCFKIQYNAIDMILDPNGSIHITSYWKWVPYEELFSKEFLKEAKKLSKKEKRKKHKDRWRSYNPLLKEKGSGEEVFTSISIKTGHKIRTKEIINEPSATDFKFMNYYEIDLKEKTVKKFWGMTERSRQLWNNNWTEKDDEAGFKKVGPPKVDMEFINCKTSDATGSGYLDYWWALILIIAVTFFIYTQSGNRLKKIRKNRS